MDQELSTLGTYYRLSAKRDGDVIIYVGLRNGASITSDLTAFGFPVTDSKVKLKE